MKTDEMENEVVRPSGEWRGAESPCETEMKALIVLEGVHEIELCDERVIWAVMRMGIE